MEEKKLLILGIDPGTTLGYAILDINGAILDVGSSKLFSKKSLIDQIIGFGKPVVIGCDKSAVPKYVEKISNSLGTRLISPKEDLLILDKRGITNEFNFRNDHERDALASALFAFRELRPLLTKIDNVLEKTNQSYISNAVKELIIRHNISNIQLAIEIVTKPQEEHIATIKKAIETKKYTKDDFERLYERLRASSHDNELLQAQNSNLLKQIHNMQNKKPQIIEVDIDPKLRQQLKFKEDKVLVLSKSIEKNLSNIKELNAEIIVLNKCLSNLSENVLLKKLKNFGLESFYDHNVLNIKGEDIILVDDPNIISDSVLVNLKSKVQVVIHKAEVKKSIESKLPFILVPVQGLDITESKYFAIVNKTKFTAAKNKVNLLKNIIENYKKERTILGTTKPNRQQ